MIPPNLEGEPLCCARLSPLGLNNAADLWDGLEDMENRKEAYLNAWIDQGIDVVIAPGFTTQVRLQLDALMCYTSSV